MNPQRIKDRLAAMEANGQKSINSTDPDSVAAKSRQGTHAVYNVQSVVDGKHGLIVHAEAVSQSNDYNQLSNQLKQAEANTGVRPEHVCGDSGYADVDDIKKVDDRINVIVPSHLQAQKENGRCPVSPFAKEQFTYDAQKDEYICPAGQCLRYIGIFADAPDKKWYQAKGRVCRACPHFGDPRQGKCTQASNGRRITRLVDEELKEQLEANYQRPENQAIYKRRKECVEHPFGHLKRNLGAGQFMLRGIDKVNAETSILATCFNMARMITIFGVTGLMARLAKLSPA